MSSRKTYRAFIKAILFLSVSIAVWIIYESYLQKEWNTVASSLAVITAVLAIAASLNLTWHQEDEKRPYINIYIDDISHKYAYSLVIKNVGGSPAYNVKLDWTIPIFDYEKKIPRFTDADDEYDFQVLYNGAEFSRFLISSDTFQKIIADTNTPKFYEGIIVYTDNPKGKSTVKQHFRISLEPLKRRLNVLNDQMDFYFTNKDISNHLKSISNSLKDMSKGFSKK
jgi:hypothetical protein